MTQSLKRDVDLEPEGIDWQVARPILWAVLIGASLVLVPLLLFAALCGGATGAVCQTLRNAPPWELMAVAAVAPSLVVVWYWRTQRHRAQLQQAEAEIRNVEVAAHNTAAEIRNREQANRIAEDHLNLAREGQQLAEKRQLPERFVRAVELLGSEKIEARLGGIYALERISRESDRDHWVIIETLTAFVRQNAPLPLVKEGQSKRRGERLADDIQAALTVIGRRRVNTEEERTEHASLANTNLRRLELPGGNLSRVDLRWSILTRANLEGADLHEARLNYAVLSGDATAAEIDNADRFDPSWAGANLIRADLRGAVLAHADLRGAKLHEARLCSPSPAGAGGEIPADGADFYEADLRWADLGGADLKGARLVGARLDHADLSAADLRSANLSKAHLAGVKFARVDLTHANLTQADLRKADLKLAVGLTTKQLESAGQIVGAELPKELAEEISRRQKGATS